MEDWSKFYDAKDNDTDVDTDTNINESPEPEFPDERIPLTVESVREFCDRLSGTDEQGLPKAIMSYQAYNSGFTPEETTDKNADIIYQCQKANVDLSFDALNPTLIMLTITFPSYDEPELRLLWARLQKWRKAMSKDDINGTTVPVFLIHLLERDSITSKTNVVDEAAATEAETVNILEANIINPLVCYITRENPTMPASEITNDKGEVMGGNVLKMLCNMEFITFDMTMDADISDIKAEVQREIEAERYLEAAEENPDTLKQYNLN